MCLCLSQCLCARVCLHSFHIICSILLRSIGKTENDPKPHLQDTFVFLFSEMAKRLFVRTFLNRSRTAYSLVLLLPDVECNKFMRKKVDHFLNWVHRNSKKSNAIKTIYKNTQIMICRCVCVRGCTIYMCIAFNNQKHLKWVAFFSFYAVQFENAWSLFGVFVCDLFVPVHRSHTTFFTFQCRQ